MSSKRTKTVAGVAIAFAIGCGDDTSTSSGTTDTTSSGPTTTTSTSSSSTATTSSSSVSTSSSASSSSSGGMGGDGGFGGSGGDGGSGGSGGGNIAMLGDCVVDAPEECDDCNQTPGDGCDDQAIVEPGWGCLTEGLPCLHVSGFVPQSPAAAGSLGNTAGGSAWTSACPAGTVLVGFTAENANNCDCEATPASLASLVPQCASVTVDAAGVLGWASPPASIARIGANQGVGAVIGDLVCATNQFVVGLHGSIGSPYNQVGSISIDCATLTFDDEAIATGTPVTSATLGGAATTQNAVCPANKIITSLSGGAGAVIDGIAVTCSTPVPTYCGDSMVNLHEECDDGNAVSGDGCDLVCRDE